MQNINKSSSGNTETAFKNISIKLEEANHTLLDVDDMLYDMPFPVIFLLSCIYGVISLTAIVANFFVLHIIASNSRMRTVANYFIANLSFADIIIGLFSIPFQFQAAVLQHWMLPHFMCSLCPFVQVLSVNVSIITLTAIALDRYRSIVHPLRIRTSKRRTKAVILFIWIVSAIASVPHILALRVILVFDPLTKTVSKPICLNVNFSPIEWQLYNHTLVTVQYLLPLSVITIAYINICLSLRTNYALEETQRAMDVDLLRNRKKVMKMISFIAVFFAISWLPLQLYSILQEILPEINDYKYINVIWLCCHWLAMTNCCFNPFIYAIHSEAFKAEIKKIFHKSRRPEEQIEMHTRINPRWGRHARRR